jgi:cytochrome c oxidase subunit 2
MRNEIENIENNKKDFLMVKKFYNKHMMKHNFKKPTPVIKYDSYMINKYTNLYKNLRLLQVDNKLYLPINANIRLIITSADVLHS